MDTPVFSEPWHAQVFALTVHLSDKGVFSWPEWAACFSATLSQHGLHKELDGGDDYFTAWIAALEQILETRGVAEAAVLDQLKAQWTQAYLTTPHGAPVKLAAG